MRRPLQLFLMIAGIALGVGVIIAIDLANQSANKAFRLSTEALVGRTTHQIRGGPSGVPEDFYRELRVEYGLSRAAPVVEGSAIALEFNNLPLRILGVDPFAEAPFRDYLRNDILRQGGFEAFFLDPTAILISETLAQRLTLEPGTPLQLQINDQILEFKIIAILDPGEESSRQGLEDVIFVDIATAQEAYNIVGRLSRIDLIISPEQALELEAKLPAGLQLAPASEQQSTLDQLTEAFELNLQALSLLGLVVGMFLIYNATMFTVLQRRHILGIFRTLGATNRQIFILIIIESGLIGVLGSLLGMGVGWGLGRGAVQLVSQTINDLYYVVNVRSVTLTGFSLLKALSAGIGASLIAALAPAWEASRVPEVVALQRSDLEGRARRLIPLIGVGGIILTLIGSTILLLVRTSLVASFGALFLILIGLALMVPVSLMASARLARPILARLFGSIGRMSVGTIMRSMSRTSVAVAALMVSLSVAIGVGMMISSFRTTVVNWLDLTLQADLFISAPTYGSARPNASLDPGLATLLGEVDGVAEVETVRAITVPSDQGEVFVIAVEAQRERAADLYRYSSGTPADVWQQVQQGALIVSEPFAFHYQIPPSGGQLTLETDLGPQSFPIVGIYYDYTSERGTVLMSRTTYQRYFNDPFISSIALHLESDTNLDTVQDEVRAKLRGRGLLVQANRNLRMQALEIFDRTFLITSALRLLAVLVAFIGVISALMALQMERAKEFATMQALGLRQRDLWLLTSLETGLMGLVSGILAIPTGAILALVLIYVINLRSFGWTIEMVLDPIIFLGAVITAVAAALIAGIYPAIRLIRQPIAENLSEE